MVLRQSPCYNRRTSTDCPNRRAGCSANCEKWQKYVNERNEEYEKRHAENRARYDLYVASDERRNKFLKEVGIGRKRLH